MKTKLFILSGPSGVGKSTLLRGILENHPDFYKPINYTTRQPRPAETEGKDYYFNRPREEFERLLGEGELLEYVEFVGELYGTSKRQLEEALKSGRHVCAVMDVDGALKVKDAYPDNTVLIFIRPPDVEALKQRLGVRHTESEEQTRQRLQRMDYEITVGENNFDYQVLNPEGHPERAIDEIETIIEKSTI